jgi:hypothetical protein
MLLRQSQLEEEFSMNATTKILVLAIVVTLGHLGNAPSAYAITISVAEVRNDVAFVKGSDAGRKQQIFWQDEYVTTTKGRGNFSFEGDLPEPCVEDDCVGTLIAGGDPIYVPLAFPPSDPPSDPPGDTIEELELIHAKPDSHDGDSVRAVGFVADGEEVQIVSGGADARLRNWALDLSEQLEVRDLAHIIYDIDVKNDTLVTGEGGWNGHAGSPTLRLWEASGSPLAQTQAPIGFVYSATVSQDKNWVACSGFYGDIVVFRNQTSFLEHQETTSTKKKRTKALAFSPDGNFLVSASTGGILFWEFPQDCALDNCELNLLLTLNHPGSWSFSIAFSPHSTPESIKLVSGSDSGTTKSWTIENIATQNQTVFDLSVDSGAVYALDWSPDGNWIVAGGSGDITVFDSTDMSIVFQAVDAHAGRVNDVAFSPDSSLIVSGGADGALKLWIVPTL